ncbi:MAG TPA: hypothetical protein VFE05_08465 [Longimicrobiaceae bacterium]|jgi:hypothetical protein|nr:hypothetical protein [Longimicrobiaceae bacterium]
MSIPPPDAAGAMSLQFDSAEPAAAVAIEAQSIECAFCRTGIDDSYHEVGGRVACTSCRKGVEAELARGATPGGLVLAFVLGTGAAVLGAALYLAMVYFLNVEIGLVAILVGWLVGKAVRKGAGGRGGVPYQVTAAVLTYLAILTIYVPYQLGQGGALFPALLVAPVAEGFKNVLGILIMGFGVLQAWRMTAPARVSVTGPYRVGADRAAAQPG